MTILNKKTLNEYQELVKNDEYSKDANDTMFHHLIFNPLIRFLLLFILLIFSIINYDKISLLARVTSDSFLNHELILGPKVYFTVLIATCSFLVVFSIVMFFIKEKSSEYVDHLKGLVRAFTIYDFVTFMLSSLTFLYFVIMFVLTPCTIDGSSMENTLKDNDRVIVWHFAYKPDVDDIVIFDATNPSYGVNSGFFVKRIVAASEDVVSFDYDTNELMVNDTFVQHVEINQYERMYRSVYSIAANETYPDSFVVPEDRYVVMGDNRNNSTDSRAIGLIYEKDILGKVAIRFYPFSTIGKVDKEILQ